MALAPAINCLSTLTIYVQAVGRLLRNSLACRFTQSLLHAAQVIGDTGGMEPSEACIALETAIAGHLLGCRGPR